MSSIRIALNDPRLECIAIVYPESLRYQIADRVEAVPLENIQKGVEGVFP